MRWKLKQNFVILIKNGLFAVIFNKPLTLEVDKADEL